MLGDAETVDGPGEPGKVDIADMVATRRWRRDGIVMTAGYRGGRRARGSNPDGRKVNIRCLAMGCGDHEVVVVYRVTIQRRQLTCTNSREGLASHQVL